MSLKAFHIVFIVLSILLCIACAAWAFSNHAGDGFGIGASIAAVALIVYGIWFIKKARNIIT
jgi:uncharacterized membrane protein SirB2